MTDGIPPSTEPEHASSKTQRKSKWQRWLVILVLLALVVFVYMFVGVFTIQPIGALPEGITLIIWKGTSRPFFDSPDRLCLDVQGGVSLLCRMAALGALQPESIIVRLPFMEWAYLISTGGRTFSQ